MTMTRDAASFEAAALASIHYLTAAGAAAVVDKGIGSVRNWTNPDHDGRPTIHNCLQLDLASIAAGHEPPFLTAYVEQIKLAGRAQDPKVQSLMVEALQLSESVGAMHGLVTRAKDIASESGSAISANEASALSKAAKRVQAELDDIKVAIRRAQRASR